MTVQDYGLTDQQANDAVAASVAGISARIEAGDISRAEVLVRLSDDMHRIAEAHPDVLDGTTRTQVVRALDPVLARAGMTGLVPWEW